jgi:peptide deformylase
MAVRPVRLYPDPVLLTPTVPVDAFDDRLRTLARDMVDTMYAAPGIGLAANQVGESLRLFVADLTVGETPGSLLVFVNPVVLEASGAQVGEEGCLSFPDITLEIERHLEVRVQAADLEGRLFTTRAEGLLARVLQHEIEHLEGETFLDNVSSLKREIVKREIRKRMRSGEWVASAGR